MENRASQDHQIKFIGKNLSDKDLMIIDVMCESDATKLPFDLPFEMPWPSNEKQDKAKRAMILMRAGYKALLDKYPRESKRSIDGASQEKKPVSETKEINTEGWQ